MIKITDRVRDKLIELGWERSYCVKSEVSWIIPPKDGVPSFLLRECDPYLRRIECLEDIPMVLARTPQGVPNHTLEWVELCLKPFLVVVLEVGE